MSAHVRLQRSSLLVNRGWLGHMSPAEQHYQHTHADYRVSFNFLGWVLFVDFPSDYPIPSPLWEDLLLLRELRPVRRSAGIRAPCH